MRLLEGRLPRQVNSAAPASSCFFHRDGKAIPGTGIQADELAQWLHSNGAPSTPQPGAA